jgi:hypothetical protein
MAAATGAIEAHGTFEVTLTPQPVDPLRGEGGPGRMLIDKTFAGDLVAVSRGEMLAIRSDKPGSAGYVAMEMVRGTLHGREGRFGLQHSGSMSGGSATLQISVVPDSGTGELFGLQGTMSIDLSQSQHRWTMLYTLPETGA